MNRIQIDVCPICGSYKVLARAFVAANRHDPSPSISYEDKGYCTQCEEEVWLKPKFISQREYNAMEEY